MATCTGLLRRSERLDEDAIGEIVVKSPTEVQWCVPSFFSLPEDDDFISSSFFLMDGEWCLTCSPSDPVWLGLQMINYDYVDSLSNPTIKFRLGIKIPDVFEVSHIQEHEFEFCLDERGISLLVDIRTAYFKGEIARQGKLTFFCTFLSNCGESETYQDRKSKGASESTEENAVNFIQKDGDDTKLEFTTKLGVNNLVQNFKDLLLKEEQSDILVKVKNKEFKAHKTILGGRSNVFSSMFAHDTLEKRTNIIEITDCEPNAFEQFLMYLYTGQVESVPGDQVTDLYIIADKYNVEDLKEECVNFMKDHMTVETFCDVMSLALIHNEIALIESATKYFAENVLKIIVTLKWITFVKENPVESNEIHIKALKLGNKN